VAGRPPGRALFVAGLVAIVFGTRVLWRQRLAVLYLLLALPALYTVVLASTLVRYTNFTVDALRDILKYIPVAKADVVPATPCSPSPITGRASPWPWSRHARAWMASWASS